MISYDQLTSLINLRHLRHMTDDTGILQHARFHIPQRKHGYCTDDNARALIVSILAQDFYSSMDFSDLSVKYLSFLEHAFDKNTGRFRNFMEFDRRWIEETGSEDSHGRAVWALGMTASCSSSPGIRNLASNLFREAIPVLLDFTFPRSWAFGINGVYHYLKRAEDDSFAEHILKELSERLLLLYLNNASENWFWVDDCLTYSNAKIPQALILSGNLLHRPEMIKLGLQSLEWLMQMQTSEKGHFIPIGNKGWCSRGEKQRACFDQQPVEAQAMTDACLTAFEITHDLVWMKKGVCSLEWFLGVNDLGKPLIDTITGGCRDGLQADGLNQNQGAESTLSWLISLFRMLSLLKQ
jgi:hypothetical protein